MKCLGRERIHLVEIGFMFLFNEIMESFSDASVEELCREVVPKDYQIYEAPKNNDSKPLNVFVGFQVLDIGEINEEKMDYHLHMFMVTAWNDSRLKLDKYKVLGRPAILYSACENYMWTPDTYYETAKEIETYKKTSPTTILNIFSDGSVVLSHRYSFKTDCAMDFFDYPFDTQRCQFLVSLMYSDDSVAKLKWLDDKDCPINDNPVQMMRDVDLPQYHLLEPSWTSYTKVSVNANHTVLVAEFTMIRQLMGTFLSTFMPSVLIVIMSWVTFWLRMDAIPARVALSITSLLTLCTQADQSKSQLPAVNYMTALDIWLFMCIITVFSTLVMTAVSYNTFTKKCKVCRSFKKVDNAVSVSGTGSSKIKKSTPWVVNNPKKLTFVYAADDSKKANFLNEDKCLRCYANQKLAYQIDNTSKLAFPIIFLLGTIFYCAYYLHRYANHE